MDDPEGLIGDVETPAEEDEESPSEDDSSPAGSTEQAVSLDIVLCAWSTGLMWHVLDLLLMLPCLRSHF